MVKMTSFGTVSGTGAGSCLTMRLGTLGGSLGSRLSTLGICGTSAAGLDLGTIVCGGWVEGLTGLGGHWICSFCGCAAGTPSSASATLLMPSMTVGTIGSSGTIQFSGLGGSSVGLYPGAGTICGVRGLFGWIACGLMPWLYRSLFWIAAAAELKLAAGT